MSDMSPIIMTRVSQRVALFIAGLGLRFFVVEEDFWIDQGVITMTCVNDRISTFVGHAYWCHLSATTAWA
ncbi:hypothetical protein DN412_05175 [Cupriavidus lacunae]|uniref:Uncharacterized protein n=1 Tax=Cupriavidus lacunae TaxID=2666307 RepID=A0A370P014_9BURK|nr:hypothetical protein DN412_05175 [Cupriavidus lacunae]